MTNTDQAEFWTGPSGQSWVTHQDAMDAMLQPVSDLLLRAANLQTGQRVLDVGCGTGSSTLPAAEAVGTSGRVVGIDISPTLLGLARTRLAHLPQVEIMEEDAQTADLPGPFEVMISRFGVMFFEDTPAAFANLARAMAPGAPMVMTAWADAFKNPYFMEPAKAARAVLGDPPKVDRSLPGPFAFEDPARVARDFAAAGLQDVTITETALNLTPLGTLEEVADLCLAIGSASSAMRNMGGTDADRAAIHAGIMERFAAYDTPHGIRIPAAIHLITARA